MWKEGEISEDQREFWQLELELEIGKLWKADESGAKAVKCRRRLRQLGDKCKNKGKFLKVGESCKIRECYS